MIPPAYAAIKNGILEFKLHGHKLKGLFTLIHTNMDDQDRDWLLIKKDDVFAVTHVYDAKKIPLYDEVFLWYICFLWLNDTHLHI